MNTARKIADFDDLTAAEQTILDERGTGNETQLGDGSLPTENAGRARCGRAPTPTIARSA
ncbi:MAG: hypothetical protein V3V13_03210 [Paracoccaceae bacterium]